MGWMGRCGTSEQIVGSRQGVTNLKRASRPYRLRLRLLLRGRVGRGLGLFFLLGSERAIAGGAAGLDAGFFGLKQAHHDIRS